MIALSIISSPTDKKSVGPSAFYARRTDELRAAIIENLNRFSRYTMSLVLIGLLTCLVLSGVETYFVPILLPFHETIGNLCRIENLSGCRIECAKLQGS
jgi:hypothetical protein